MIPLPSNNLEKNIERDMLREGSQFEAVPLSTR